MSDSSHESETAEFRKRLNCEPFLVQRLGLVAINLGCVDEFTFLLDQKRSPIEIYNAIFDEIERQGLPRPYEWLELFEIPYLYD